MLRWLAISLLAVTTALGNTPPQVINKTCPTSQWFESIVPGQIPTCTQPAYTDINGLPSQSGQSGKFLTTNGSVLSFATVSGGSAVWGDITGTLSNQTDLQSALNAKQNSLSIGTLGGSPNGSGLSLSGSALTLQPADATNPGALTPSPQTIGGAKTFVGAITASNLSGTNTGNVTLGTANGLSLASQALSLQAADSTHTGALTSEDWIAFDTKQPALTFGNLTASTTGVNVAGGTGAVVGSGADISISIADGSQQGLLSSADWNTFNNKQDAGSYITNLSGDVVADGPGSVTATIQTNVVDNTKLSQMPAFTLKGNSDGGTNNANDLSGTAATAILDPFIGDFGEGGTKGLVPAPVGGEGGYFLRGDGVWAPGGWSVVGNTGTDPSTNFLGTIDSQDLVFRTANTEQLRISTSGALVGPQISTNSADDGSVRLGSSTSVGNSAVAVGNGASAESDGIAIGNGAVSVEASTTIGEGTSSDSGGISLGFSSNSTGGGVAIGFDVDATNSGVSISQGANGSNHGVAVGSNATGTDNGVAIGANSYGAGDGSVALGGGNSGLGTGANTAGFSNTIELGAGTASLDGGINFRGVGVVGWNGGFPQFIGDGSLLTGVDASTLTGILGIAHGGLNVDASTFSQYQIPFMSSDVTAFNSDGNFVYNKDEQYLYVPKITAGSSSIDMSNSIIFDASNNPLINFSNSSSESLYYFSSGILQGDGSGLTGISAPVFTGEVTNPNLDNKNNLIITDAAVTESKIADAAVTNAKLANMPPLTLKGNLDDTLDLPPQDLTGTEATSFLVPFVGSIGEGDGTKGLVPQPLDADAGKYLSANGSWVSAGTVSSVDVAVPSGGSAGLLSVSGGPITSSGTITISTNGTSGGLAYFSSSGRLASSGAFTANRIMLGGGAGNNPTVVSSLGTTTTLLHGNASGAPTFGAVSLTTDISGVLPVANGGTNSSTSLSNNRVMKSSGGTIIEAAAITASRALESDTNGIPVASATTSTELGYVSGVTSAIQTQLNAKGVGSVTSVGFSVPATSILGTSGSPVTSSGTLGLTTTGTSGGIPYFSSTSALSSSAALTANAITLGGGAGTAPNSLGSLGTTTTVLHGNAAGAPTFGAVSLTADVTGVLPMANGGTNKNSTAVNGGIVWTDADSMEITAAGTSGQALLSGGSATPTWGTLGVGAGGTGATTKAAAFDALSPMTTSGDIVYGGASGTGTRLPKGSNGDFLTLTAGIPAWTSVSPGTTVPSIQKFTSGSGTYTKPANVLYLRVEMVGGGGGGAGGGVGGNGGNGGTSTFGTTLLSSVGGNGGVSTGGAGGTGGTASLGTGPIGNAISGGGGDSGANIGGVAGGSGAATPFGGSGSGGSGTSGNAGSNGVANSGAGGGGGGGTAVGAGGGGGGGSGYVNAIIGSPSSTYSYAVGAGGTSGTSSAGGGAGGVGGTGFIQVTEYYQ